MSRLYDRSFAIAFASQVGFVLAWSLSSHYSRWIAWLGGSPSEIGWYMGAGAAAAFVLRPWTGQWINRYGARRMWGAGYALFAAGSLGNLLVDALDWRIYVLRAALMLAAALVYGSSLTYITQVAPRERHAEAIGSFGVAGFIGMLAGPYLGDLILGHGPRSWSDFEAFFFTTAAVLIVPAGLLLFLRSPAPGPPSKALRLADFIQTARRHWPGGILAVCVVFGTCMTVPFVFLPDWVDALGSPAPGDSPIGRYFLAYAASAFLTRIGLRTVPDRFGRRRVLAAGLLLFGAGMFAFLAVDILEPWSILLPAALCGGGHGLTFHTMISLTLESFPSEVRGTGSALVLMAIDLGTVGGAPILGGLVGLFGYPALFAGVGCACLFALGWPAAAGMAARKLPAPVQTPAGSAGQEV